MQQFRGEFIKRPEAVRLADSNITMEGIFIFIKEYLVYKQTKCFIR